MTCQPQRAPCLFPRLLMRIDIWVPHTAVPLPYGEWSLISVKGEFFKTGALKAAYNSLQSDQPNE